MERYGRVASVLAAMGDFDRHLKVCALGDGPVELLWVDHSNSCPACQLVYCYHNAVRPEGMHNDYSVAVAVAGLCYEIAVSDLG